MEEEFAAKLTQREHSLGMAEQHIPLLMQELRDAEKATRDAASWEEVRIMSTTVGALRRSVAWIVGEEYVYDAGRDDVKCCVLVGENGCLRGHHLAVDAVNTGNPRHNDVCGWVYEYKSMGDLK